MSRELLFLFAGVVGTALLILTCGALFLTVRTVIKVVRAIQGSIEMLKRMESFIAGQTEIANAQVAAIVRLERAVDAFSRGILGNEAPRDGTAPKPRGPRSADQEFLYQKLLQHGLSPDEADQQIQFGGNIFDGLKGVVDDQEVA